MSKVFDSSDMQRVINQLNAAIQSLQNAQKRIEAISLDGLTGDTRDAIQQQIAEKTALVQNMIKTVNSAIATVSSKQNVLK